MCMCAHMCVYKKSAEVISTFEEGVPSPFLEPAPNKGTEKDGSLNNSLPATFCSQTR